VWLVSMERGSEEMRTVKMAVLCVLAAFAMSAVTAASASAAAPEFGRCVKKAKAEGAGFSDGGCTKAVGIGAKFEWTAEIAKKKFSTKMSSAIFILESVLGSKITCTAESSENGEYTGPKAVGGVILKFNGCETGGGKVNTPGKATGEVVTFALEGELGVGKTGETPAKNKLALALFGPSHGNVMEFECTPAVKVVVRGSILLPVAANKMVLSTSEKFTSSTGEQKPDKFAGEGMDAHTLEWNENGREFVEAGLSLAWTLTNEEKVEASSVN
jgi:hypothetical protein